MHEILTRVSLEWTNWVIPFDRIDEAYASLDQKGLYAILSGIWYSSDEEWKEPRLLYIGKAYNQTIRKRVKQPHPQADDCMDAYFQDRPKFDKLLLHGWITSFSQERITQQLFSDTETCLIRSHNPLCNIQSKYSYSGRTIKLINSGGEFAIMKTCSCSDDS